MAKKYNYLCLWLFFFPAAHFYETFWPRKIWSPPNKKVWVSGSRNCQNTSSNWERKKKARKNCCQKHSRFGGRKSGSQWPFLTISASFLTWYIFIDSLIKSHENGDEKWLGDIWPTFSRFSNWWCSQQGVWLCILGCQCLPMPPIHSPEWMKSEFDYYIDGSLFVKSF